jgi:hypothetical protein
VASDAPPLLVQELLDTLMGEAKQISRIAHADVELRQTPDGAAERCLGLFLFALDAFSGGSLRVQEAPDVIG